MQIMPRYQVFISSTYDDLREERQQATEAVLQVGSFPSGMELFPASNDTQWELIKQVIQKCDYYLVIVGGRYGSLGPDGASYTEMEYDYATETGIPVLGFVKENLEELPVKKSEQDPEARRKLQYFRKKVLSRNCYKFSDPANMGMAVMKSLMHEMRVRPRVGWIRGDQGRSEDDHRRELKIREEIELAHQRIRELEREVRDRSVLRAKISQDDLAQGEDVFEFDVMYRDQHRNHLVEKVAITWNEILRSIGPSLYGYIVRKASRHNGLAYYPFKTDLEALIRSKIFDRIGNRQFELREAQIDTCVIQLKELGLICFAENNEEDRQFRGITLTEFGEGSLSLLNAQLRSSLRANPESLKDRDQQ